MMFKHVTLRMFLVYLLTAQQREMIVETLAAAMADKALTHNIAATFSLDEIAQAHQLVETGQTVGNVVLKI